MNKILQSPKRLFLTLKIQISHYVSFRTSILGVLSPIHILTVCFCIICNRSYAECNITTGSYNEQTIVFDNISVQRDTEVGTVIATKNITFPKTGAYCQNDATGTGGHDIYMIKTFTKQTEIQKVFETNIPGVGIRISTLDGLIPDVYFPSLGMQWTNSSGTIELVKTGPVTQSGILTPGTIMEWWAGEGIDTNVKSLKVQSWILSGGSITKIACALNSGNSMSFPIGNVPADQFTQIGTLSKQSSTVGLSLDCDENANVNITLSGIQNPDSTDPSILALSNQGDYGVAQGIGVKLFYNDKALELNKLLNLKKSAGGLENFPITARYVQTKNEAKAGQANATATINITYQ